VHAHTHVCTHMHTHTCMHTCTLTHICMHTHMYAYTHACTHAHTHMLRKVCRTWSHPYPRVLRKVCDWFTYFARHLLIVSSSLSMDGLLFTLSKKSKYRNSLRGGGRLQRADTKATITLIFLRDSRTANSHSLQHLQNVGKPYSSCPVMS
jgi:hypothetical protein